MADEYERQKHEDRLIATMYRLDPEKLAAIRRAASGKTRCPNCDTLNPADQRKCYKCGANLYYDLPEEKKTEEDVDDSEEQGSTEKTSNPEDEIKKPPYY